MYSTENYQRINTFSVQIVFCRTYSETCTAGWTCKSISVVVNTCMIIKIHTRVAATTLYMIYVLFDRVLHVLYINICVTYATKRIKRRGRSRIVEKRRISTRVDFMNIFNRRSSLYNLYNVSVHHCCDVNETRRFYGILYLLIVILCSCLGVVYL